VVQHTKGHFVGRVFRAHLGGTYTANPCCNSANCKPWMHLVKT